MIFADAPTPNANMVWIVIIALASVGANIATIFVAFRKKEEMTVSPQPLVIEMQKEFVSKPEFHALVNSNDQTHRDLFSKIGGVERGANGNAEKKVEDLRIERREDMRALHHEINEVTKKVAGIEKETELQNQTLAAVTTDIKTILQRLPRRHE